MAIFSTVYIWCAFLLLVLVRLETDAKLTEDFLRNNAELLKDIKSYEIIKPYRIEGRRKRHASTRMASGHLQDTTIVFAGRKKRFDLKISLNKGLFSPQFEEYFVSNDPGFLHQLPHEHCFYHGTVNGEKNSDVSLSTCDGIEGVIRTDHGTFLIQPLKSQNGQVLDEHVLFNVDDLNEQPATCGHGSHKTSLEKEIGKKSSTNIKTRVRRNILSETKYVELFIINDNEQYKMYGKKSGLRAKQMVNHLDSIYRYHQIRIALVNVETWNKRDLMTVDTNATKTLQNFLKYKYQNLDKDKGKHFDNVQLLTSVDFDGNTVGFAPIKSICGKRSAGIVQDHSKNAAVTASTMAHELGHNFGMVHDVAPCECPGSECIMKDTLSTSATRFSTCSLSDLRKTLENGYGTCLFDEPNKLYGKSHCGNGFVEEGEQCDCGTQKECDYFKNTCCNATTCMLHPEAACSHGECCENCQKSSKGKLCRKKYDDCDLPEYCTGDHEMCPEDYHIHDGIPCKKNEGYCYSGVCQSIKQQCQYLFGDDMRAGSDKCFNRNTKKVLYGCYNETNGHFACPKSDVKCGKLHCLSNRADHRPIRGQDRGHHWAFYPVQKIYCIMPFVTWGDGVDRTYVEDGTKCDDGKMCLNSRCLPINDVVPVAAYKQCPNNCSGNGVCNNKGHCHCNSGYACPDCSERGSDEGGSVDSGQGCKPPSKKGGVNVAAAVLIPLFLLLLIGVAVLVYIKRRTIQDRLSHYKFVRRSTGRSSNVPPPRKSQPSVLHAGLISNPTPANQPVVQSRRPVPSRSTVALVPNEQPEPTSTPQLARDPLRPPSAPVQGNVYSDHQSVPLFPPSANTNPVPQETVGPRPPPPSRPPAKSNLPRTPSAPPTAPNRPKLPPSQPPPNFKSVPDIPSATQPKTTPPVAKRTNAVPPRPKPRASPGSHNSVPEFPDDVPVPKPRSVAPRPGHQSVPLFNLPDNPESGSSVKPSAVKANQAKPSPPRKPRAHETGEENRVDFRAGLKPVPKPWEKL